jgi:hypothetical protein
MITGMATWAAILSGLVALTMIALFASGALYARPTVMRLQHAHDAELARVIEDCDYYRRAAQSCSEAVAHREGQLRIMEAMLYQQRGGRDGT